MTEKQQLREIALKARGSISIIEIAELSARINLNALKLREYKSAQRVLCYCSFSSEVGTYGLLRQILADGKELYVPKMRPGRKMDAVRLRNLKELAPNARGIPEPGDGETIDPAALELLLLPGVAFDRTGGRVGYGAGYIDRLMQNCAGAAVGLAYELQMVDRVPMEAHDARMRYVATERGIYDCGLEV